ncbi:MAG: C69 family dipeptidase [Desulfobacterales bacterium]|nr:C69 family dipeptidase [Desulfobacterales bacterium]
MITVRTSARTALPAVLACSLLLLTHAAAPRVPAAPDHGAVGRCRRRVLHGPRRPQRQRRRLGHGRPQRGRPRRDHRQPPQDQGPRSGRAPEGRPRQRRRPRDRRQDRRLPLDRGHDPGIRRQLHQRPRRPGHLGQLPVAGDRRRLYRRRHRRDASPARGGTGHLGPRGRPAGGRARSKSTAIGPRGRTYSIADKTEAWMLAVLRGRHWYAQRVPDDEVAVIPNHFTIRGIRPDDAANFLGSTRSSSNTPRITAGTTSRRTGRSTSRRPSTGPPTASSRPTATPCATGRDRASSPAGPGSSSANTRSP